MKSTLLVFAALLMLTSCGADGEPTAPAAKPGLAVSGDVQIGVKG